MISKKTKIVVTIGPSTENEKTLEQLVENGMDVIRLNFSHNEWEWHQKILEKIKKIDSKKKKNVAILQDLSGPKMRTGKLKEGKVNLVKGKKLILTTKDILGNEEKISVNYKNLPQDVKRGDIIKLEDGKKSLRVERTTKDEIHTTILAGGILGEHKGVNVPGVHLSVSSLTKKDKKDVLFGIQNKVDYIALSFVQSKKDILSLKKILKKHNSDAGIIAKIETSGAVKNFDEILKVSDGIMIARGDLAIEIGAENVPLIQKEIIKKCNLSGKPVITATQMLDSMEHSPVPTRAEVSDIANAILDGTDALMLSGETTIGKFPLEAIKTMVRTAKKIESFVYDKDYYFEKPMKIVDAITRSTMHIAREIHANHIVTFTESGTTARMLARFKPKDGILAITSNDSSARKLKLSFGVFPIVLKREKDSEKMLKKIKKILQEKELIQKDDKIVITMGYPFGTPGSTNKIVVEKI